MADESIGSVTRWIADLKEGNEQAAQQLWRRYFAALSRLAEAKLGGLNPGEGDDVALSALASAMIGIRAGKFPAIQDRTSLWPLLVTITARKSTTEIRRLLAGKRSAHGTVSVEEVAAILSREPSTEFALEMADELERLLDRCDDDTLRAVAMLRLQSLTHAEIAERLNISVRTVVRKLNRLRAEWTEASEEDGASSRDGAGE
ncbi:MAG: ECF-type sigma factor [Planctomycetota bacterium]